MHAVKFRAFVSALILLFGFGCYAPSPKKGPKADCLSNETVWLCRGAFECVCSGNTIPLPPLFFCARIGEPPLPADHYAEQIATQAYSSKIAPGEVLHVACEDQQTKTLPDSAKGVEPPAEFEPAYEGPPLHPEAWGDSACSSCVAAQCKPEAIACAAEVLGCHCLEQCQLGDDSATTHDLSTCGCAAVDTGVYEALWACVHGACLDACFPPVCACP